MMESACLREMFWEKLQDNPARTDVKRIANVFFMIRTPFCLMMGCAPEQ